MLDMPHTIEAVVPDSACAHPRLSRDTDMALIKTSTLESKM
jgi:hypothetical protein